MKEYHKLLPLATGYFGVSSALYAFDGLIVVYGPAGGAWHINIEDEPRWYRGPATVVGAGLLEMDVILGNEKKFIENIARVATQLKRRFVALAGTPISEIIGTDLRGFSRTLEAQTDKPVFMVPTAGSEPYPEGAAKAFLALAGKFMRAPKPDAPRRGVNVLGAIHLSCGKEEHIQPVLDAIEAAGMPLVAVFSAPRPGEEDPLAAIRRAPEAELNVVVSTSGIPLAEFMHAAYGTPYVVGMPVGLRGRDEFLALLRRESAPAQIAAARPARRHAVVVGEPVLSHGIRRCLQADFGVPRVDVVSVLPDAALFAPGKGCLGVMAERGAHDVCTDDEAAIAALLNDPDVDCVVADPCYAALLDHGSLFVPMPHIAMSARLNWDMPYEYALEKGHEYLAAKLSAARA